MSQHHMLSDVIQKDATRAGDTAEQWIDEALAHTEPNEGAPDGPGWSRGLHAKLEGQ